MPFDLSIQIAGYLAVGIAALAVVWALAGTAKPCPPPIGPVRGGPAAAALLVGWTACLCAFVALVV